MFWMLASLMTAQVSSAAAQVSKPWTLLTQGDKCTVARTFGDDGSIRVGFETVLYRRPAIMMIRGPRKLLPDGYGELSLTLDDTKPIKVRYVSFIMSESDDRLTKLFLDDDTMKRLVTANLITVGRNIAQIQLAGVKEAIYSTEQCAARKLASWGINPDLYFSQKTAEPTAILRSLFVSPDYPREAREKRVQGRVIVLLKADENGTVMDCKVLESDDRTLDAGTCEIARRGQLKPPLDAAGQPIASYAIFPVRWSLS